MDIMDGCDPMHSWHIYILFIADYFRDKCADTIGDIFDLEDYQPL